MSASDVIDEDVTATGRVEMRCGFDGDKEECGIHNILESVFVLLY